MRALLICPDNQTSELLKEIIEETGTIDLLKTLPRYPEPVELMRLIRAYATNVIFYSTDSVQRLSEAVRAIGKETPGVQVVAVGHACDPQLLLDLMEIGIRHFVSAPFSRQAVGDVVGRVQRTLDSQPPAIGSTQNVFSFLPAKAGVGTSTVALNVSFALSRRPDTRVLLTDLDLNAGMLRFMLKLGNPNSVLDAAEHAANMDPDLWAQLVESRGGLDVLHASEMNPDRRIEPAQVPHLMDFARRNYDVVCYDLSGSFERYSLEVMHESKRIFLVSTQEVAALHLARERVGFLDKLGLRDRVSLVLNRCPKREPMSAKDVEGLVGLPIAAMLPNEYRDVQQALDAGEPLSPVSELGRRIEAFADLLVARKPGELIHKRRFLEFFSVIPGRYPGIPESRRLASGR